MFKTSTPVIEAPVVMDDPAGPAADVIPISVLTLDLPELPVGGWEHYCSGRGIEVVADDIGRPSIGRSDARQLLAEHAAAEERRLAAMARAEQRAIADDRARRASIWQGVSVDNMPPGVAPALAMLQSAKDSQPRRTPTRNEWLFNEVDDTMIYHELQGDES